MVFCSSLSISSPFSWFSCCSDTLSSLGLFLCLSFLRVCAPRLRSVAQLCPTLCDPEDCSLPRSPVHGIFQPKVMEWATIYSSKGSLDPGIEPASPVSPALADGFFTTALSYFFGFTRNFRLVLYISCHGLQIFPSIRVFSNESALCIRWPEYWNFNFSISPSSEYSGLFACRIDWFDLSIINS